MAVPWDWWCHSLRVIRGKFEGVRHLRRGIKIYRRSVEISIGYLRRLSNQYSGVVRIPVRGRNNWGVDKIMIFKSTMQILAIKGRFLCQKCYFIHELQFFKECNFLRLFVHFSKNIRGSMIFFQLSASKEAVPLAYATGYIGISNSLQQRYL